MELGSLGHGIWISSMDENYKMVSRTPMPIHIYLYL